MKKAVLCTGLLCMPLMLFSQWEKVTTEDIHVDAEEASSAAVMISMTAGEIRIDTRPGALLSGSVRYSDPEWKPYLWSKNEDGQRKVSLKMRSADPDLSLGDDRENQWDLHLDPTLPADLLLSLGAGTLDADLAGARLTSLYMKLGAGEFHIDVSGSSVPRLMLHAGVGEVHLDLGGTWDNDLVAQINGGIGELTLYLPENVAVFVKASGLLGEIHAPGFHRKGNAYLNDAFRKKGPVLRILVQAGIGRINLESR